MRFINPLSITLININTPTLKQQKSTRITCTVPYFSVWSKKFISVILFLQVQNTDDNGPLAMNKPFFMAFDDVLKGNQEQKIRTRCTKDNIVEGHHSPFLRCTFMASGPVKGRYAYLWRKHDTVWVIKHVKWIPLLVV